MPLEKISNGSSRLALLLLIVGCGSTAPRGILVNQASLVVAHLSGGEAPTLRAFSLNPNGDFAYGYIGQKPRKGQLAQSTLHEIEKRLGSLGAEDLAASDRAGMDRERIVFELKGRQYVFLIDNVPDSVQEFLEFLDMILERELGERYEAFFRSWRRH